MILFGVDLLPIFLSCGIYLLSWIINTIFGLFRSYIEYNKCINLEEKPADCVFSARRLLMTTIMNVFVTFAVLVFAIIIRFIPDILNYVGLVDSKEYLADLVNITQLIGVIWLAIKKNLSDCWDKVRYLFLTDYKEY